MQYCVLIHTIYWLNGTNQETVTWISQKSIVQQPKCRGRSDGMYVKADLALDSQQNNIMAKSTKPLSKEM